MSVGCYSITKVREREKEREREKKRWFMDKILNSPLGASPIDYNLLLFLSALRLRAVSLQPVFAATLAYTRPEANGAFLRRFVSHLTCSLLYLKHGLGAA